ncbi:hypothetical protein AAFP35_24285 [Gordonia sp. CPCC 206044]|uniref:hypothetical protein n=1 Tax=Gordonia sp. CPCC 206044 TaxID=3140793 RepID=UPI003AF3CAE9
MSARVHGWTCTPTVRLTDSPDRPIVVQLERLRISLPVNEARTLADALHDAIDTTTTEGPTA